MSTNQMTETDALAECLAPVLDGATSFGSDQAERACNTLAKLYDAKKIDMTTFSRVNSRLGNHSALRQWAIKMGLLPASDAKPDALCLAIRAIFAKRDADLEAMANVEKKG